jgi:mono/diheme cytochrome c family protein
MHRTVATLALLFALISYGAAAQGVTTGQALAERWCKSCHVIDRAAQWGAADGVPSFPAIASRPSTTPASLDRFLSSGHTRMPDFSLGHYERAALVEYILSLRR